MYHKFLNFFPRFERWAKRYEGQYDRHHLLRIFNQAQDYFINWIIKHDWGLPIRDDWLYNAKYQPHTHTTERIADDLLRNPPPPPPGPSPQPPTGDGESTGDDGESNDQPGSNADDESPADDQPLDPSAGDDAESESDAPQAPGDGEASAGAGEDIRLPDEYDGDINNKLTEQQIQELELDNASQSHNAERMAQPARGHSKGDGSSDPFMDELEKSRYRATFGWKQTLDRYADSRGSSSFSYARRSRRNVARNQPLIPGKVGKELGTIVFVIDSSGSTSGGAIEYGLEELQYALDTNRYEKAVVIWCSDGVPPEGVLEYKHGDTIDRRRRRCGGGTEFMPAFKIIAEKYSDAAVISYLTDGGVGSYDVIEVNEFWRTRLGMKPLVWALIDNGWGCTQRFIEHANQLQLGKVCKLPMEKIR